MEELSRRLRDWQTRLPHAKVRAVVRLLQGQLPVQIAALGGALTAADPAQLADAAHKLRGSVLQFGTQRMVELSADLEATGQQGSLVGAAARIEELEEEFQVLNRFLAEELHAVAWDEEEE